ncbi:CE1759 family FMN reductase [Micrococcus luteus]|nr:CE1759 family FMN reductase [Micrococcus luteus]
MPRRAVPRSDHPRRRRCLRPVHAAGPAPRRGLRRVRGPVPDPHARRTHGGIRLGRALRARRGPADPPDHAAGARRGHRAGPGDLRHLPALRAALDEVAQADAVIAVSPTYKASYSGLFKSFWDLAEPTSVVGVPVLLGATGGTARHSLMIDTAMRPLFAYLKARIVPTAVFAASDDWGEAAGVQASMRTDPLQSRIRAAGRDLAEITLNRPPRARAAAPADLDLEVTPFEQLLNPGP